LNESLIFRTKIGFSTHYRHILRFFFFKTCPKRAYEAYLTLTFEQKAQKIPLVMAKGIFINKELH